MPFGTKAFTKLSAQSPRCHQNCKMFAPKITAAGSSPYHIHVYFVFIFCGTRDLPSQKKNGTSCLFNWLRLLTNDGDVGLGCSHLKGTDENQPDFYHPVVVVRFFGFKVYMLIFFGDMHMCHTHTIHVMYGIFTYTWLNFLVNVGKYMDGMGYIIY